MFQISSYLFVYLLSAIIHHNHGLKCYQCDPSGGRLDKNCHQKSGELRECNRKSFEQWIKTTIPKNVQKLLNETTQLPLKCATLIDTEDSDTAYARTCIPEYKDLCKELSDRILIDGIDVPLLTNIDCRFCSEDGCNISHHDKLGNSVNPVKYVSGLALIVIVLAIRLCE